MRLFVAVWPAPDVLGVLESLDRPDDEAVRWTSRAQWHVTLRFLGQVAEEAVPGLGQALQAVAERHRPRPVELGPETIRLGRRTLAVPVAGLDDLAAAIAESTSAVGRPPDTRPLRAHLTLARSRGDRPLPRELAGRPVHATWPVEEITLVRSDLEPAGARYETITTAPLTG